MRSLGHANLQNRTEASYNGKEEGVTNREIPSKMKDCVVTSYSMATEKGSQPQPTTMRKARFQLNYAGKRLHMILSGKGDGIKRLRNIWYLFGPHALQLSPRSSAL